MDDLAARITSCRACPRLVSWREQVAREKRAAFAADEYWGRPVPGFGDAAARMVVVGLAPAAHGANRTGRMFTGDRSGDWLFRALHRAGFASQPTSTTRDDGLQLHDCWVTAAVRCAPPGNRPEPDERERCRHWLEEEFDRLLRVRVVVCLGQISWAVTLGLLADRGVVVPRPRPRFAHLGVIETSGPTVIASYHPSQQNTFTGRLSEGMLDAVFARARAIIHDLG
jgi:uracil-DNA glycosylase family 4